MAIDTMRLDLRPSIGTRDWQAVSICPKCHLIACIQEAKSRDGCYCWRCGAFIADLVSVRGHWESKSVWWKPNTWGTGHWRFLKADEETVRASFGVPSDAFVLGLE